eukprot:scaffold1.g5687.t1
MRAPLGARVATCRLLDPQLAGSFPPAILARPSAIVVNLETVKLVLTEERAFLTNLDDPSVAALAEELCRRLAAHATGGAAAGLPPKSLADLGGATAVAAGGVGAQLQLPFELQVLEVALETVCGRLEGLVSALEVATHPALDALTAKVSQLRGVLEALLDDEDDLRDLNLGARSAELGRRVTEAAEEAELERHAAELGEAASSEGGGDGGPAAGGGGALVGAEELGGAAQEPELLEAGSPGGAWGWVPAPERQEGRRGPAGEAGAEAGAAAAAQQATAADTQQQQQQAEQQELGGSPPPAAWEPLAASAGRGSVLSCGTTVSLGRSRGSSASSEWEDAAVEVVEALLQSFFFSMDQTWNRLRTLTGGAVAGWAAAAGAERSGGRAPRGGRPAAPLSRASPVTPRPFQPRPPENIDDTEDYINIQLDNKRNQLIGVDLVLTSVNAGSALIIAVTALFAMNMKQSPDWVPGEITGEVQTQGPYWSFVVIDVTLGLGAIALVASVFVYARMKGLLNLGGA